MSADTLRASIDKSTDLPTPEPEKMLPAAHRDERVECAHAKIERFAHAAAMSSHGARRQALQTASQAHDRRKSRRPRTVSACHP
ncbi:MAG: hypothetical protein WB769_01580, partial [Pseudolabrys sp.]